MKYRRRLLLVVTLLSLAAFTAVGATGSWHTPGPYENGDKPPAWADAWSMAQFQHPVIYGGDEATAMEFDMKPFGFKGYSFTSGGVAIYYRVHLSSNPMDRGKRYHSYEVYAKDATGAVSFWQGWQDYGDPATTRFLGCDWTTKDATLPLHGQPHGWVESGCGKEAWYARAQNWQWDVTLLINDATTVPTAGETADTPQSQWVLTGKKGVKRTLNAYWYGTGSTRYPTRNNPGPRGWFCADFYGTIVSYGSSQCGAGLLPQYIAPTMPTVEAITTINKTYSATGIQIPN